MPNAPPAPINGFLRLKDVLKIIPVGKSTWWRGVKIGQYPQPYKIGEKITVWRAEDIQALVETIINPTV